MVLSTDIPQWLIVYADVFLVVINLFNVFVLWAHLHPVESPFKKHALKGMEKVVSPFHTIPFLNTVILAKNIAIAAAAGSHAHRSGDMIMLIRAIIAAYTFLETRIFIKLSDVQLKLGIDKVLEAEQEVARHDMLKFQPPSLSTMNTLMAPMKTILRTDVTGASQIPDDQSHLFVMNHSLYGIDMPFFIESLYRERNVFVRGLADHMHFASPHGSILKQFGAVDGTRANVDALMEAKQDILVYPGGAHEILKHSSVPRYELMWKERLGFARMAIKHKYPIIPCAAVGTEDMLDTVMDIPVDFARKGQNLPIVVTSPNKVQKIYFYFGEAIPTAQYNGDYQNDEFAREVRDKTKAAIEAGIKEMQAKQEADPDRYLMDRFTSSLKRAFSKAYESFYESLGSSRVGGEESDITNGKHKSN